MPLNGMQDFVACMFVDLDELSGRKKKYRTRAIIEAKQTVLCSQLQVASSPSTGGWLGPLDCLEAILYLGRHSISSPVLQANLRVQVC